MYSHLADAIVAIHVAWVAFIVFGQLAIWIGIFARWPWIRNPWFRWIHLAMMTMVGLEAIFNITCPLTAWEASLRELAGEQVGGESFLGRLLRSLIFVNLPTWTINTLHVVFALLVIGTFILVPPRPWTRLTRQS